MTANALKNFLEKCDPTATVYICHANEDYATESCSVNGALEISHSTRGGDNEVILEVEA